MALGGSLPGNLRLTVERYGGRVAIVERGSSVSYGELWCRCQAFANALRANGLRAGDRVAFALDSSWQYAVAYYGSMLAGGIAVPLNSAAHAQEVAAWSDHAEAKWRFHSRAAIEEFCTLGSEGHVDHVDPSADQPAAIHYTSGTTGSPKGVLLSHANLTSNAESIISYLKLTESDSVLCILPFYYAYGSSVLNSHMLAGGRIVIEHGFTFPRVTMERLVQERVTGFAGVPTTFALLLGRVRLDQLDLSALRYVTQAGGAMSPSNIDRLRDALPGKQIYVMYGQTEATSRISYLPPGQISNKRGSVGIPIPGVSIEIRDDAGNRCEAYRIGRVCVSGPNVMLGYWRSPEATERVLQRGWLDTGDVGYLDDEGYLFLSGRRSDVIKVGAHRVHPQDVEDVIAELVQVSEVAVIGVDDELLGEVIKAFVVLNEDDPLTEQQIRRHCLERLAPYKVPKHVEFVSTLPRTASGKIRRAALSNKESV